MSINHPEGPREKTDSINKAPVNNVPLKLMREIREVALIFVLGASLGYNVGVTTERNNNQEIKDLQSEIDLINSKIKMNEEADNNIEILNKIAGDIIGELNPKLRQIALELANDMQIFRRAFLDLKSGDNLNDLTESAKDLDLRFQNVIEWYNKSLLELETYCEDENVAPEGEEGDKGGNQNDEQPLLHNRRVITL